MSKGSIIAFAKVNKWFDDFHVLRDIDLSVTKGERIVICGPSGSGNYCDLYDGKTDRPANR